jgi:hypothetical protein
MRLILHAGDQILGDLQPLRVSTEYPPRVPDTDIVEVQPIPYQQVPDGTAQLRLVEHVRTLYYNEGATDPLAPRQLGRHGLSYEHYRLV